MKFKISSGASIHLGCKFSCARLFELGQNSTINQNCYLDNRGGIFIKNSVTLASRCAIICADHQINLKSFAGRERPITIEDYVFLGYGSTVLGGVVLEYGSIVGACSLITKSTEKLSINFGVPAQKVSVRLKDFSYPNSYSRLFH